VCGWWPFGTISNDVKDFPSILSSLAWEGGGRSGWFQDGFLPPVRVLHVGLAAHVRFGNPRPQAWFSVGRGFADEAV